MKNKELQSVTFEQAKRLKAAGFDWYCNKKYAQWIFHISRYSIGPTGQMAKPGGDEYFAPTVALALKWFRDTTGIISSIDCLTPVNSLEPPVFGYKIFMERDGHTTRMYGSFATFEAAESALLDELLNIIEKQSLFIDVKQPEIEEI